MAVTYLIESIQDNVTVAYFSLLADIITFTFVLKQALNNV